MPEESLEAGEIKEAVEEALEHAEHGAAWTRWMSLSTAVIAVLAAIASLKSGGYANESLLKKNEAVLLQAQASDQWSYYQAKGIKALVVRDKAESARYKEDQEKISEKAKELEIQVKERDAESFELLERHHKFAFAVTFFQVAIALSAIAALTKQKPLWWVSMGVAVVGVVFLAKGFV